MHMPSRPELGAALDHACLQSAEPQRLAEFLELAYSMKRTPLDNGWQCTASDRSLLVRPGRPNSAAFFAYAFDSADRLAAHRRALAHKGLAVLSNPSPLFDGAAYALADPDGNVVAFGLRSRSSNDSDEPLSARLQHLAFRTPRLDEMVSFYESVGFVVSDRVKDDDGVMRACFLRSDHEHHALALFRAPDARFDHLSCETHDIASVIGWADRMAKDGIPIHWGVGRHGPGNDVFFMVKDPDGNLLEISAEIEHCDAARPAGTWRHEQRTLNLWGTAIMRS
jgi:catechol 2,3-dioxygenase-like lactoylglutathione lyase family enzyme